MLKTKYLIISHKVRYFKKNFKNLLNFLNLYKALRIKNKSLLSTKLLNNQLFYLF